MTRIRYWLMILTVLSFGPAYSATEIELVNERTVDGEKDGYIVKALYEDTKSRYAFYDQGEDQVSKGIYLLSLDGGKTAHYIDENENTCHQWSNEEFVEALSQFMLKTSDKFNVKATDQEIEKIFEKPAEAIHGLEVRHIRFNLQFSASYKYLLFKDKYRIERLVDIWVTPKIDNIDVIPFMQAGWQRTGNDTLDQKIVDVLGQGTNYRLRSETQQIRTDKKGKQTKVNQLQFIRSIQQIDDLPEDTFVVPECRQLDSKQMEKKFKDLLKDLVS